ncbi:hypothetical protein [Paenibacillus bovis]|uniref:Uncharacterized protein n=1 Tax=Paenibacillus bovis TaxID=1616788 RepID=A0A172ZEL0_9BACL|nr:hypothetical protein [Paenibacillus bovis]ANF95959.1 hypothetical protein AR543_08025 [Paenibacillus bovis]
MSTDKYETFKYFLDCYIVTTESYIDVLETVQEFQKSEREKITYDLICELVEMKSKNKWEEIQAIIVEHSFRRYNPEKTKLLIEDMLRILN